MSSQLQSILFGTSGLTLAALLALWLSSTRGRFSAGHLGRVRRLVWTGVGLHALHFFEELLTGFHVKFPELLGLTPWTSEFFVVFNSVWMVIWLLCPSFLTVFPRTAAFPLWFLAIACVGNAIAHPLLAGFGGGYFPGLLSSPMIGVLGVLLIKALISATEGGEIEPTPA